MSDNPSGAIRLIQETATKRCPGCGNTYPFNREYFYKYRSTMTYCKACGRKKNKEQRDERKRLTGTTRHYSFEKYRQTPKYFFSVYKSNAKKRGHAFNLTLVEFSKYWNKPCTYCGDSILTIGLDRVNSSRGYEHDNIVSCCITCNRYKHALSLQEWKDHVKRLYQNLKGQYY